MNKRGRILALMAPPSLWLLAFFVLPLLIMVAFTWREGTFTEAFPLTWKHYKTFWETPAFTRLLGESTLLALLTALISILLAYPVAYFLVFHGGKRKMALLTILILPAWTSFLLRVLAWKTILGSSGLLNQLLLGVGLIEEAAPILLYSRSAVLITLVYVWLPFATLPLFATLERIEPRLLEAAEDLGASPRQAFWRVTLPLSLPGVASAFFFVFIPTLGEWVTPTLVGGLDGIMYGNLIQDQFVRALNWPLGALLSLVLLVLISVFAYIFNKFIPITEVPVSA